MLRPGEMTPHAKPLYICLRKTVDWSDEAAFRAQLDPTFAAKVEVWNTTFRLPYHHFRHELRQIAQANHEQVVGAMLSSWEQVPHGALVAPVDDDDWFAPQMARVITATATPDLAGLLWKQSVLERPINRGHWLRLLLRRWIPGLKPRWLCATNSYVIRKGFVDPRCFHSHVAASRWFPAQPAGHTRVFAEQLSVHNRSLGSITALNYRKPTISADWLRRRQRSYVQLYKEHLAAASGQRWALPWVRRMEQLMEGL